MRIRTENSTFTKKIQAHTEKFHENDCDLVLIKQYGVGSKVFQPKYFEAEQS